MKKLLELFTDAKNRPEVKAVMGVAILVIGLVWLFWQKDVTGFLALAGFGTGLLGIKTIEDIQIDKGAGHDN